ncbi:hypothetical protein QQG55_48840 [Brugia pahangi]|uniref:Uncharacterized protein n=1 Tax=Brugia pahangi TaxID=6280 RepID=A0A0N4TQ80_BRUPA|nr:unnamed protein product [Brugia pahangi]
MTEQRTLQVPIVEEGTRSTCTPEVRETWTTPSLVPSRSFQERHYYRSSLSSMASEIHIVIAMGGTCLPLR